MLFNVGHDFGTTRALVTCTNLKSRRVPGGYISREAGPQIEPIHLSNLKAARTLCHLPHAGGAELSDVAVTCLLA